MVLEKDNSQASEETQSKLTAKPTQPGKKSLLIIVVLGFLSGIIGAALYGAVYMRSSGNGTPTELSKKVTVLENSAVISLVDKVSPSVVSITTTNSEVNFFGQTQQSEGAGTGMVATADGIILTNKHVVDGGENFTVIMNDKKKYAARVLAIDPGNDIAFLKIDAKGLKPVEFADSTKVVVGQSAIAIGNALGQFQNSVTTGIISGKSRPITAASGSGGSEQLQNLFQTDAAINPGNSGGPLLNIDGQVIGINTAVAAGQQAQNIGFAIPINEATAALASVKNGGKIQRPYLGVRYQMIDKEFAEANKLTVSEGALIRGGSDSLGVVADGPAAKAGLTEGDIIVKVNDTGINSENDLSTVIKSYKIGDTVKVTYVRSGKTNTVSVKLEASGS